MQHVKKMEMDTNENLINSFAGILKNHNINRRTTLYYQSGSNGQVGEYKVKDVIASISSQLKDIQNADRTYKPTNTNAYDRSQIRKSNFLPVHAVSLEQETKQNVNKFETQCVLDTQLINIFESAEAIINEEKCIMQEFDKPFCLKDLAKINDNIHEENSKKAKGENAINNFRTSDLQSPYVKNFIENKDANLPVSNSASKSTSTCDNFESISNSYFDIYDDDDDVDDDAISDADNGDTAIFKGDAKSPIIYVKSKVKSSTPPPLIFRLESFEKFEAIALPVIKEAIDLETAKIVINSQIKNNELFIQSQDMPVLRDRDKNLSPIHKVNRNLNLESDDPVNENRTDNLLEADSILFSSDEENDFHKNQKLPMTCALQTEFYNECDIVDKTMYVGFQTANNKSIKISADSFKKAKCIFDNATKDDREMVSATNVNDSNLQVNIPDDLKVLNSEDFNDIHELKTQQKTNRDAMTGQVTTIHKSKDILNCREHFLQLTADCGNCNTKEVPSEKTDNEFTHSTRDNVLKNLNTEMTNKRYIANIDKLNNCKANNSTILSKHDKSILKVINTNLMKQNKMIEYQYNQETGKEQSITTEKNDGSVRETINRGELKGNKINTVNKDISTKSYFNNYKSIKDHVFVGNIILDNVQRNLMTHPYKDYNLQSNVITEVFRSTNDKPDAIYKEAVAITKDIFKDYDIKKKEKHLKTVKLHDSIKNEKTSSLCANIVSNNLNHGFRTASNKQVHISEEALAKTKNIFQDIGVSDNKITNEMNDFSASNILNKETDDFSKEMRSCTMSKLTNCISYRFNTASNKPVAITAEALAKSKSIFQEMDLNYEQNHKYEVSPTKRTTEVLSNSKKVCQLLDFDNTSANKFGNEEVDVFLNEKSYLPAKNSTNYVSHGFKTAANKPVVISEEALALSKNLFQDMDTIYLRKQTDVMSTERKCKENLKVSCLRKNLHDFNIDDHGADKTTNEDANVFLKHKELSRTVSNSSMNNVCQGFKTASNKSVAISVESFAQSKNIFQDIDMDYKDKQRIVMSKIKTVKTEPFGLKMSNNIQDKVSEEVLEKSKNLVDCYVKPLETKNIKSNLNQVQVICEGTSLEESFSTEVIKDFENTIYTEDFAKVDTPKTKRASSPILSCPRAKRRKKFETPTVKKKIIAPSSIGSTSAIELKNMYKFNEHYKKFKKYSLKYVDEIETSRNFKNVDSYICKFKFETLLDFEFKGSRNDIDKHIWNAGKIKEYFTDSINRKIIPEGWVENHLRLIIWKLICYEIRFPHVMKNVCTVKNIMEQLKYRYERELYNVERPALRKILEKDEVSSKGMILFVAAIYVNGLSKSSVTSDTQNIELLLSDGWYTVKTSTDRMIDKLVCDHKIRVGTKLLIHGAELLNCEQGIAPWEDTSSVRLKIFGNSTRRAEWDARLGFHGNASILTPLSAVKPEGGKVQRLRVVITRVYPTLYIEKFPDGSTLTRSERLENIHQMKHEAERQIQLEKLYEELEKYSEQESQDSEVDERMQLDTGSQISRLMKRSRDREEFRANLTNSQAHLLEQHKIKKKDRILEDLQMEFQELVKARGLDVHRNVVPLIKMRVADVGNGNITKAMVTIWRPTELLQEMLKEGTRIDMYNVVPTSVRYSEVQISAGRLSIFRKSKLKQVDELKTHTQLLKRQCYTIKDLQNPSMNTVYNEIDTVGLIFLIDPSSKELSNQLFQNVYLTDADKNIISINFWGGIKKFGFENILDTGQVVTCVNLQKRSGNTWKNIQQYRATEFSYFTRTSKIEAVRKMADDLTAKFNSLDKRKFMDECVVVKNNFHHIKHGNTENISPYRLNTSDYNVYKNKVFIDSPLVNKSTDINLNLTGLDFESTFKQTDSEELSPQTLLRKRKANEKIAKLKMYGEPPPISPIHIINKSVNTIKQFKSPYTKNYTSNFPTNSNNLKSHRKEHKMSDILPKIEKEFNVSVTGILPQDNLQHNINSSPVLSLNKTYVKRTSINPVKLNFSNVIEQEFNNNTDPFAEDFDPSPPISLE